MAENSIKNIAIFRTDRIGEVLLSTVAVSAVKKNYPGALITFVTSSYSKDIIEMQKDIARLIIAETSRKSVWFIEALRLALALRPGKFDMAIVLNPNKALHLACFLAGIPIRAGYNRKWPFLLTDTIEDERGSGEKHETEYTMDFLRKIGITVDPSAPALEPDGESKSFVGNFLKANLKQGRRIVAVHSGASNPAKMWPKKNYAELVKKLKAATNAEIVFIGDDKGAITAKEIIAISGEDVHNFCGKFTLKELAAFLMNTSVFIGSDTGPMHMAASLGVPVVAIFGRNIPGAGPKRWGPLGDGHTVLHRPPECDPCDDSSCRKGYLCLENIKPDDVLAAALKVLNGGA